MAKIARIVGFLLLLFDPGSTIPRPPPNYSQDNMPDTTFTCNDKVVGGYYADPEAACQMFHVCVRINENDFTDFRFLCPNNTLFDQENFICANWFDIDCEMSTKHYSKNLDIYPTEAPTEAPAPQQTPVPHLTRTHEVRRKENGGRVYEYVYYDYDSGDKNSYKQTPSETLAKSYSTTHQLATQDDAVATKIQTVESKDSVSGIEKQTSDIADEYPYYYEYYYDYDYDELKDHYDINDESDVKKSSFIDVDDDVDSS